MKRMITAITLIIMVVIIKVNYIVGFIGVKVPCQTVQENISCTSMSDCAGVD